MIVTKPNPDPNINCCDSQKFPVSESDMGSEYAEEYECFKVV